MNRLIPIIILILILPAHSESMAACDKLASVQTIPMKGEDINDAVYNEILDGGYSYLPCLVEQITNTQPMKDPRMAPTYHGFVVGDLAFFLFVRITGEDLVKFLPAEYQDRWESEGVYAYFDYVKEKSNREALKQACKKLL